MIYFLGCQEFVKIGFTNTATLEAVHSRIRLFDVGNPFEITILGVMAGNQSVEFSLHRRFNSLKVKGEWFRVEETLTSFLRTEVILPNDIEKKSRLCRVCAMSFLPTATEDSCSLACNGQKRCTVCQTPFYPSKKNSAYCSPSCYHRMMSTMSAARIPR